MVIVRNCPTLHLVIANKGEGCQAVIHLRLSNDDVNGGLILPLTVSSPLLRP